MTNNLKIAQLLTKLSEVQRMLSIEVLPLMLFTKLADDPLYNSLDAIEQELSDYLSKITIEIKKDK